MKKKAGKARFRKQKKIKTKRPHPRKVKRALKKKKPKPRKKVKRANLRKTTKSKAPAKPAAKAINAKMNAAVGLTAEKKCEAIMAASEPYR